MCEDECIFCVLEMKSGSCDRLKLEDVLWIYFQKVFVVFIFEFYNERGILEYLHKLQW